MRRKSLIQQARLTAPLQNAQVGDTVLVNLSFSSDQLDVTQDYKAKGVLKQALEKDSVAGWEVEVADENNNVKVEWVPSTALEKFDTSQIDANFDGNAAVVLEPEIKQDEKSYIARLELLEAATASMVTEGWGLGKTSKGVTVSTKTSAGLYLPKEVSFGGVTTKISTTIKVPKGVTPLEIANLCCYKEFVMKMFNGEIIVRYDVLKQLGDGILLVYEVDQFPWPLTARDIPYVQRARQFSAPGFTPNAATLTQSSVSVPEYPNPVKGFVRLIWACAYIFEEGKREDHYVSSISKAMPADGDYVKGTICLEVNPGGKIPKKMGTVFQEGQAEYFQGISKVLFTPAGAECLAKVRANLVSAKA
jgi:hypothetical protein